MVANEENTNLIKCGNHSYAPWHIVCRHLFAVPPPEEWVVIEKGPDDERDIDNDWLCTTCVEELDNGASYEDLMTDGRLAAVCMHCVNDLKKRAGFVEEEI